ncbi:MAG: PGN_0703 family putative restriction endonuclease [Bacteroidota bacterium]
MGTIPNDEGDFKRLMRLHQGWWRTAVLCENPGKNPGDHEKQVCNTIEGGEESRKNFLSEATWQAVTETLREREEELGRYGKTAGLFNEDRLYNNLLSSQPLAFNFFGELKLDLDLATQVIRLWEPEIDSVDEVRFEYAPLPKENYTDDHSAFDVAFFCRRQGRRGLIGLEVKYTDDFSREGKQRERYRAVFDRSRSNFAQEYEDYFSGQYVQLFRSELLAQSLIQRNEIDFAITGLFCHPADLNALRVGEAFKGMLTDKTRFRVATYRDFIERVQKLNSSWSRREWTMKLWARYCGLDFSAGVLK